MIYIIKRSTKIPNIDSRSWRTIKLERWACWNPNAYSYSFSFKQNTVQLVTLGLGILFVVEMLVVFDSESFWGNIIPTAHSFSAADFWSVRIIFFKGNSICFKVFVWNPSPATNTSSVIVDIILWRCPVSCAVDDLLFWKVNDLIVLFVEKGLDCCNCGMGVTWVAFALVFDWSCKVGQVNVDTWTFWC